MVGIIGIDVSKGYGDAALLNENLITLERVVQMDDTRQGHDLMEQWIRKSMKRYGLNSLLVGVESTGGMEDNWYSMLVGLSTVLPLKVARLNPSVVKNAAMAQLHANVTDAESAINIARYLKRFEDQVDFKVQDKRYSAYRSLMANIQLNIKQSTQLVNHLKQLMYTSFPELMRFCKQAVPTWVLELLIQYPEPRKLAAARPSTVAKIKNITLDKAHRIVENAKKTVASRGVYTDGFLVSSTAEEILHKQKYIATLKAHFVKNCKGPEVELLATIKGVGEYSAAVIMSQIEDIERFPSPKQLASYFGLHPVLRQSGDKQSVSRMSKQGRPAMRAALFMCANSAILHDSHLKRIYANQRAMGKSHKQAIGVVMHKLLRIAWGMLKSSKPYDPAIDKANQERSKTTVKEMQSLETESKRRIQPFDEGAPISRIAFQKRRMHVASQSGSAENTRDLEHASKV